MNPQHHNPTQPRRKGDQEFKAHAPYNFVPLPEESVQAEPVPSQDRYHPDRFTGYLDCTLTTQSPLYTRTVLDPDFFRRWADKVREMMKDNQARTEYAQFPYLDNAERPFIPGSSLRGMVRSLVEIGGYGKVQWVTNEPLVFRAVADAESSLGMHYHERMKPSAIRTGYLEHQGIGWQIRPAKPIAGKPFARIMIAAAPRDLTGWKDCQNARSIYIQTASLDQADTQPLVSVASAQPATDLQQAVLVKTGRMPGKEKDFVFGLPDETANPIDIPDAMLRDYRNQITQGQMTILGKDGVLRPMQPVFYLVESGELAFFGHSMMFRLPYPQTPLDLVPSALRKTEVDLAESIFGYLPKGKNNAGQAGRVFFTDARFQSAANGIWLSDRLVTPQILSSPKPTTFQHYLTQQEPDRKRQLDHYASPPPHETVIRGHKLYWHKGPVSQTDIQESAMVNWAIDTQHTQIKPVNVGVTFSFSVHFENLSKVELGALLWVLQLPAGHCHKIGMGKPLGMGAVDVQPTLHLTDRVSRYKRLFNDDQWFNGTPLPASDFRNAFEAFVLKEMDQEERGKAVNLISVPRIRALLKMLEWRGPIPDDTKYMALPEYKERPVLPDPLNVATGGREGVVRSPFSQATQPKPAPVASWGSQQPAEDSPFAQALRKAEERKKQSGR